MAQPDIDFREFVLSALVEYECRLVRYSTRLFYGNEDRARDVVQHAFMKLCEQDPVSLQDRLGPWLFRVCRNRAVDELRRESGVQQMVPGQLDRPDVKQADPSTTVESTDLLNYIQQLIGRLPEAQQEIVELWSQGLKHDEIAEVVEKKAGAVRGTLHRALKSLKGDERIRQWISEMSDGDSLSEPGLPGGNDATASAASR